MRELLKRLASPASHDSGILFDSCRLYIYIYIYILIRIVAILLMTPWRRQKCCETVDAVDVVDDCNSSQGLYQKWSFFMMIIDYPFLQGAKR